MIDKDRKRECRFCGAAPLVRDRQREEQTKTTRQFKFFRCDRCGLTNIVSVEKQFEPVCMQ